jgi:UrcA family protein
MSNAARFLASAFSAVLFAAAAQAGSGVVVRHVPVAYSDLDIGTPDGAAMLKERIAVAATKACGSNPHFDTQYRDAPRFVRADFTRCRTDAIREASWKVGLR